MKKIRTLFTITAVMVAIGGAYSSHLFVSTYYENVTIILGSAQIDVCLPRSVDYQCSPTPSPWICETNSEIGVQLKESNFIGLQCGRWLFRDL